MKFILLISVHLIFIVSYGQKPKKAIKKLGDNPVFFIDSVMVDKDEMNKYQPNDIAGVSVYHDSTAIRLIGPDGKDGVVYIETKTFAKNRYWNYFKSKSPEYAGIVPTPQSDTIVQYILNTRILKSNFEGDLSLIDDSIFKGITVIDSTTLQKDYGISGKPYGVIIKSDKPKDLYRAKKKF